MTESTDDLVARMIEGLEAGSLVTKFVVIAEVIDPNGERGVWTETQKDATRWDTYGLLTEALQAEKARQFATELDD